jgi:hypothetical protein
MPPGRRPTQLGGCTFIIPQAVKPKRASIHSRNVTMVTCHRRLAGAGWTIWPEDISEWTLPNADGNTASFDSDRTGLSQ